LKAEQEERDAARAKADAELAAELGALRSEAYVLKSEIKRLRDLVCQTLRVIAIYAYRPYNYLTAINALGDGDT
jgi:hypothetical protein